MELKKKEKKKEKRKKEKKRENHTRCARLRLYG